jgi:ABC-type multidrug transport system ATPase subunit
VTAGLELSGFVVHVAGRVVLDGLRCTVPPGTSLAITGPAGSGTSTVLRAIVDGVGGTADAAVAESRVTLDGAAAMPRDVGVVTQGHELIGGLSAAENVVVRALGTMDEGRSARIADDDWTAIEALLGSLGLPESSWHNLAEQLSGGQQQRVAIARALVGAPRLLCLDDPTSELDAASRDVVWDVLRAAMDRGAVVVLAAPDPALVERCDQVVRIGRDSRHDA